MSKIKRNGWCVLALLCSLCLTAIPVKAESADKQLQKGIEAYQKKDKDKAMDYFVDVLMNGDTEQVNIANKYISAIHNEMGGIKTPVEVDVRFPDQPTQTLVNRAENLANYGTEKLDTLATQSEEVVRQTEQALGAPKTLTQQIEERQLSEYIQNGETPVVQEKSATPKPVVSKEPVATQAVQPQANALQTLPEEQPAQGQMLAASSLAPEQAVPTSSSTFDDLTSPQAIEARNLYTQQKLQSMTDSAVARISANNKLHLYMRPDGRPDALDIDDDALFYKNSFRSDAVQDLDNIFELLALTQGARYIILPAGSYTDDVTLGGIRQAMALKSYLVKRGISQGKLYYNMGLVDEEVPAQFSNLKGLSIVFDYDASLPTRVLENEEKEKGPLLSMAVVPSCHAIDRSLGEAYAIDFSVLETVDTLDNWTLQVIQHGRDGSYYIVRQLEGFSPVYHQILWNGRKGIIGPELPCGKYTVVLSAVDLKGKKQTLRRRLVVRCAPDPMASCQMGTCPAKKQRGQKSTVVNYKSSRLWNKPGRVMHCLGCAQAAQEAEQEETFVQEETQAQVNVQEAGAASSTDRSSYTVTKTVRNVVTDDDTINSTATSSSQAYADLPAQEYSSVSSTSAVDNPYGVPYEEEYTEISY